MARTSPRRLGELDHSSVTDALFQLGELLARTNAASGLVQSLRFNQVSMTLPIGQWAFRAAETITPGAFTPACAAQQFAELDEKTLSLILGGYARLAYQQLDPLYPGFTDSLLAQLLPNEEVIVPKPRPVQFDIAAVLQTYGVSLQHQTPELQVHFASPRPPVTPISEEDLLITTLVLFVMQQDLAAWLMQVAACEPTRRLAQVLSALARGEFATSEWSGLLPKLLAWVVPRKKTLPSIENPSALATLVLAVLTKAYAEPGRLAEIYANVTTFKVLRTALDQLPPDSLDATSVRINLLFSTANGLYTLAKQADTNGQAVASIQLAQQALITLQLLPAPTDPEQVEAWLAWVQAQEYTCQWSRLTPDQPLDSRIVQRFSAYASTARLMTSAWGTATGKWYDQGRVTNQFWTATWFSLERLRLSLRLSYALSQQAPLPKGAAREQAALVLKYLLDHYHQAQREVAAMIARNLQPGREMSMWVQTMLDEGPVSLQTTQVGYDLRALKPVEDTLRRQGYGPEVLTQLGKLAASLVPIVPGHRLDKGL